METLTQVAQPSDATRAQWRMALVQAHTTQDWPLALSVLGAMARAGVDVADGDRDAMQVDYVIAELGTPDDPDMYQRFARGYEYASKEFYYEGDHADEADGADYYRAVYHALDWALTKYDKHLEAQYQAALAAGVAA